MYFVLGICLLLLMQIAPMDPIDSDRSIRPMSAAEHGKIYLDGNVELDSFCSGNTTTGLNWAEAHVIGNFSIDRYDERENCISLLNIDRYVILRNVTLETYYSGISIPALHLNNVSNIRIENLTVSNSGYGILLVDSTNCTVQDSVIKAGAYSIHSTDGNNINITNTISDNFAILHGFHFINGRNIIIDQCTMRSRFVGLGFEGCQLFDVQNTSFQQNIGITIEIDGGNDSMIYNNTLLSSTSTSYAVKISNHLNFSMISNDFSSSNMGPIFLWDCENGSIANNNMSNQGLYLDGLNYNLSIPESNRANGKLIKYYENDQYLNETGGEFAQVIINHVNHSYFSNIIVEDSVYIGIQVIDSVNTTLNQCKINSSISYGILILKSNFTNIHNSSLFNNLRGIGVKYSSFVEMINNTVIAGVAKSFGFYFNEVSNVTILHNDIRGYDYGMYIGHSMNITGRYNSFTACTFKITQTTDVVFDDTNMRDGKPMYYFYGVSNQILNLSSIGKLFIDHCQHLLIINAVFEGTNEGIYVQDSFDIAFFNITVSNSTGYLFQAEDVLNLTLMNSSFLYSDYGLRFDNVTNLIIKNCYISNVSEYGIEFYRVYDALFSQNWIVNVSETPFYIENFDNVTITDNCYANNGTDWLEIDYDTGNETIFLDNNLNQTSYNASYFLAVSLEDLMTYWNRTAIPSSGDPESPGDTNTTTTSSTSTTTPTSTDPPSGVDSEFDWGVFLRIAGLVVGIAVGGVLITFMIFRIVKNKQLEESTSS